MDDDIQIKKNRDRKFIFCIRKFIISCFLLIMNSVYLATKPKPKLGKWFKVIYLCIKKSCAVDNKLYLINFLIAMWKIINLPQTL